MFNILHYDDLRTVNKFRSVLTLETLFVIV